MLEHDEAQSLASMSAFARELDAYDGCIYEKDAVDVSTRDIELTDKVIRD